VGRSEALEGSSESAIFSVPNPRRLSSSEKEQRIIRRRERRLSRSILRARERTAAQTKAAKGDTSPVTAEELKRTRHRLSSRQLRLSRQLANVPWRNADIRDDFLHKTALAVARSAEVIVVEDLHVAGMLQNRALAKSLSDAAMGKLEDFIRYKAERAGGVALKAPRFFASSKRCSACGHHHADLTLDVREWSCSACGVVHDRDENAATNLCWLGKLALGLEELPETERRWAEWLHEAREKVEAWRAAKAASRQELHEWKTEAAEVAFVSDIALSRGGARSDLGAASPEVTRGEIVDRGRGSPPREAVDEPRTKKGRRSSTPRGEQAHICSPFG
jgi:IS605 OrfB family transposase